MVQSALLTAICVALGQGARQTNRAKSIKTFVKEGTSYAMIALTLHNGHGADAFRPDEFGDTITVVRRIAASGASTFKLMAGRRDGAKVSSDRKDLESMLDHFNIDVNNPMVVMTQDSSREMMSKGRPSDMYNFYMRATQLEELRANLVEGIEKKKAMKAILSDAQHDVDKEKEKLEELEQKMREYQEIRDIDESIGKVREQAIWACVAAKQREADEARDEAGTVALQAQQKEAALQKAQDALARANEAETDARQGDGGVSAIVARMEEIKGQAKPVMDALKAAKKEANDAARQKTHCTNSVNTAARTIASLQKDIKKAKVALQGMDDAGGDAKVRAAREAVAAANAKAKDVRATMAAIEQADASAKAALQQADGNKLQQERDVRQHESDLQRYSRMGGSSASVFSPVADQVLKIIENNPRAFARKPLGPLGALIKLTDQRWSGAVSMQLSKSLDKFVCSSMADAMRLRDLCRRNRIDLRRVNISAVNFDLPQHNISPERQPDPSLTTIYKVLKGEHAVVINVLVDVEKIEQVVLMPEENADAKDVAFGRRRRNVKTVVCGNGTRMEMKGASEVMRPFGGRLQAKIGADQGALIAETRAALEAAKAKLAQACAAAESSKREYGGMQQQVRAAKLERKKAADAVTLAEAKLDGALAKANDNNPDSQQATIEALQAELEREQASLQRFQGEEAEAEARAAATMAVADERNNALGQMKANLEQAKAEHEEAYGGIDRLRQKVQRAEGKMADAQKQLAGARKNAHAAEKVADDKQAEADRDEARVAARFAKPDVMPRKTQVALETDMERLEKRKKRAEAQLGGGSYEELRRQTSKQRKRTQRSESTLDEVLLPFGKINDAIKARSKRFKVAQKDTARQVSHRFQETMAERGHQGMVDVNYDDFEVNLRIQLNMDTNRSGGVEGGQVTDVRSMSGGEKSFSTLAFALGLGQLCDSPVRAMDEFDVFMDKVNRRISTTELMKFAFSENFRSKQFLLLTPNDITMLDGILENVAPDHAPDDPRVLRVRPARSGAVMQEGA